MMLRLFSSALIGLLVALTSLASARAQLLVITAGDSQSVSRTLRVDTSMAVSGMGLTLPGAINAAALMQLERATPARLTAGFADGSSIQVTGSLGDFPDALPRQIVRNTAGEGLRNASSLPAAPSAISVSTSVPAITALGGSQAVISATTLRLDLLTVFP
jgi:hypothetical protein